MRKAKDLSPALACGLALYLNSTVVDQFFRMFNGHTQVNATDLRALPYPSLRSVGCSRREAPADKLPPQEVIDALVERLVFRRRQMDISSVDEIKSEAIYAQSPLHPRPGRQQPGLQADFSPQPLPRPGRARFSRRRLGADGEAARDPRRHGRLDADRLQLGRADGHGVCLPTPGTGRQAGAACAGPALSRPGRGAAAAASTQPFR